ncbi:aldo/keto reductase [Paenibacillus koleovorans]|uniref:aldo/keto reductase n=1 Tax=Paenibacillus koleovorans TaxID=121608 RepID=UPI000FDB3E44|nr:aldo/keto reductase [Paenibacillus koleovorans]
MTTNNSAVLHNGVTMPWLGLGVWKMTDEQQLIRAVHAAVEAGYRSIDTAAAYRNEEAVGEAIRTCGIAREELFITSKVWNGDQGYDSTLQAFDASMDKLGIDVMDLYLIHWPVKGKYKDTWRAIEKLYADGRIRAIGVSNFHVHHFEDLLTEATIVPMVDQVELHPRLSQEPLREYCRANNIQIEAWSPLMQGRELLELPLLAEIGARYGKSAAQVILRWDIQSGIVTIPKSVTPERIRENAAIFDFELSTEDMAAINALNENRRIGSDPDNFNF